MEAEMTSESLYLIKDLNVNILYWLETPQNVIDTIHWKRPKSFFELLFL